MHGHLLFEGCRLQVLVLVIKNIWTRDGLPVVQKSSQNPKSSIRVNHRNLVEIYSTAFARRCLMYNDDVCFRSRGVTRLDGAWSKKQVWRPHVRTWDRSEANVLYWRKYLWHFWDFWHCWASPAVIRRPHSDSASGGLCPLNPPHCAPVPQSSLAYIWPWVLQGMLCLHSVNGKT